MYDRLEDTEISVVNYVAQDEEIAYSSLRKSRNKEKLKQLVAT